MDETKRYNPWAVEEWDYLAAHADGLLDPGDLQVLREERPSYLFQHRHGLLSSNAARAFVSEQSVVRFQNLLRKYGTHVPIFCVHCGQSIIRMT